MRGWSEVTESSIWSRHTVHLTAWRRSLEHCLLGMRGTQIFSCPLSGSLQSDRDLFKGRMNPLRSIGLPGYRSDLPDLLIMVAHRSLIRTQAMDHFLYSFLLTYLLSNLLNTWFFHISVFPKFLTLSSRKTGIVFILLLTNLQCTQRLKLAWYLWIFAKRCITMHLWGNFFKVSQYFLFCLWI